MKIAIVSDLHLGYDTFRADAFKQAKQALDMANEIIPIAISFASFTSIGTEKSRSKL